MCTITPDFTDGGDRYNCGSRVKPRGPACGHGGERVAQMSATADTAYLGPYEQKTNKRVYNLNGFGCCSWKEKIFNELAKPLKHMVLWQQTLFFCAKAAGSLDDVSDTKCVSVMAMVKSWLEINYWRKEGLSRGPLPRSEFLWEGVAGRGSQVGGHGRPEVRGRGGGGVPGRGSAN